MSNGEQPVMFDCQGERLLGIVHRASGDTGVVVVVGGPQYRAGSHRLFVNVARALAAAGHPVLRFDVRGMGDSTGPQRSFENLEEDVAAALEALRATCPQVQRIVLWGLCDGASAALLFLARQGEEHIAGLVLLNPWVRSAASLARAHVKHYYWQRLRQASFWRKALGGGVATQALRDLFGNLLATRRAASSAAGASESFQQRMLRGTQQFAGSVLWVLSGRDYTAKEFLEFVSAEPCWQAMLERPGAERFDVPTADHTFSDTADAAALSSAMVGWLGRLSHRGAA